jgi:putative membrane protein
MDTAANIGVTGVALLHFYILFIEMFGWETRGKKVFAKVLSPELFAPTKGLAANLGLYNGFLGAGLLWSLGINDPVWQIKIASFFLICVAVAGIYGGVTADKKILLVQTLPAAITMLLLYLI